MYLIIKSFLFLFPAEVAHKMGMWGVRAIGQLYRMGLWKVKTQKVPTTSPFGLLTCPLGLAAGFDKNAQALFGWEALGFGFVEIGTVTPKPQPGNSKPRMFRLKAKAGLINRLGFNNLGVEEVAANIKSAKDKGLNIKVGGNIGKNFDTEISNAAIDYKIAAQGLSDIVDYLVINVSSPNTPGLRDLQNENMLEEIVMQVCAVSNSKPIFIKVAPDHFKTFQSGLITIMQKYKLSGIICGNTLATHAESKMLSDSDLPLLQKGGLSGQPIFENNLALVKSYSKTNHDLFIIGVGGIATSAQLLEYKNAGAQLFQLYSALVFKGPQVINEIITPLVKS